jgi:hypothetical protein
MSSFLPYREDDGHVYIYEYEDNTDYNEGEVLYQNEIFYRVEKNFTSSGTSAETDFGLGNLGQFNKMDMTGSVSTIGPVDDGTSRGYGNRDVSLVCPTDKFVVGYRMYGVGANNYPDGVHWFADLSVGRKHSAPRDAWFSTWIR